ncbi:MAG: SUMF1/EgtB/PvdO family nonheme iron enzyme [Chloroflexota bacterium]
MKLNRLVVLALLAIGLLAAVNILLERESLGENGIPQSASQSSSRDTIVVQQPVPMTDQSLETPDFYTAKINPIDGASLVFIPSGEFMMGAEINQTIELCFSYRDECLAEDFADEEPVHAVKLSSFWIFQHEVSNEMYRNCVDKGGCQIPALTDFYNDQEYSDHPVVYINWYAAADYCDWAGGRLPTEAEWEKAARGADQRFYPWGEVGNCQLANYKGCVVKMTNPINGLKEGASPFGVLNLAGNVAEWTADWYSTDYFSITPYINPIGPMAGEFKVIRGGSWKNPVFGLRTTNRAANFPEIFSTGIGFRCVIDHQ